MDGRGVGIQARLLRWRVPSSSGWVMGARRMVGGGTEGRGEVSGAVVWEANGRVLLRSRVRLLRLGGQMPRPAQWSARMAQSSRWMVLRFAGGDAKLNGPNR